MRRGRAPSTSLESAGDSKFLESKSCFSESPTFADSAGFLKSSLSSLRADLSAWQSIVLESAPIALSDSESMVSESNAFTSKA